MCVPRLRTPHFNISGEIIQVDFLIRTETTVKGSRSPISITPRFNTSSLEPLTTITSITYPTFSCRFPLRGKAIQPQPQLYDCLHRFCGRQRDVGFRLLIQIVLDRRLVRKCLYQLRWIGNFDFFEMIKSTVNIGIESENFQHVPVRRGEKI
jgi:hypothetical protein